MYLLESKSCHTVAGGSTNGFINYFFPGLYPFAVTEGYRITSGLHTFALGIPISFVFSLFATLPFFGHEKERAEKAVPYVLTGTVLGAAFLGYSAYNEHPVGTILQWVYK